jgi:hypothetical protein
MYLPHARATTASNGALRSGTIAGIVVGVILFTLTLSAGILCGCKRRATRKRPTRLRHDGSTTLTVMQSKFRPHVTRNWPEDNFKKFHGWNQSLRPLATSQTLKSRFDDALQRREDTYIHHNANGGHPVSSPNTEYGLAKPDDCGYREQIPAENPLLPGLHEQGGLQPATVHTTPSSQATISSNNIPRQLPTVSYSELRPALDLLQSVPTVRLIERANSLSPRAPRQNDSELFKHLPSGSKTSIVSQKAPSFNPVSLDSGTISPWDLEFEPNPVIFAHLAETLRGTQLEESSQQSHELCGESADLEYSLKGGYALVLDDLVPEIDSVPRMKRSLDHSDVSVTSSSKSKRRARITRFDKGPRPSSSSPASSATTAHGTCMSFSGSQAIEPFTTSGLTLSPRSAQLKSGRPALGLSGSVISTSTSASDPHSTPTSSAPGEDNLPFRCVNCKETFRTIGQQKEHENRKHVRRFQCSVCPKDFNLRADVKRHEKTVHKIANLRPIDIQNSHKLICPNVGCKSKDKVWLRKDNFNRHVQRCSNAIRNGDVAVAAV